MRTSKYALMLSAAMLALAACTQNELADSGGLPEGEYPLVIEAGGLEGVVSRATVDGDWDGVADIAVKVGGEVKKYSVSASGNYNEYATLSSTNPFYWTSREDITVSAWWPFNDTDITRMPAVKVAEDQSQLADFQNSDFISAENRTVEFDEPKLTFTHRTARVAIELQPGTGFTSVDGATVSLVNLSAEDGNPTAIQTYHASGNSYEALTAPQTVAAGEPFIQVELGDGTFYFCPQNDVVLEAGNRYTYTVSVNKTGLSVSECTIDNWDNGGSGSGNATMQ